MKKSAKANDWLGWLAVIFTATMLFLLFDGCRKIDEAIKQLEVEEEVKR